MFAEHDLELEHVESYRPKWPTLMTYHHSMFVLVPGSGPGEVSIAVPEAITGPFGIWSVTVRNAEMSDEVTSQVAPSPSPSTCRGCSEIAWPFGEDRVTVSGPMYRAPCHHQDPALALVGVVEDRGAFHQDVALLGDVTTRTSRPPSACRDIR